MQRSLIGTSAITPLRLVSEDQFRIWAGGRGPHAPLAVKGHTFTIEKENIVRVDGGTFVYEEALDLVRMLNSPNPFAHMNATIAIWERNGVLRLLVLALIAIIIVAVIALARS
jgi:hypothetical protein